MRSPLGLSTILLLILASSSVKSQDSRQLCKGSRKGQIDLVKKSIDAGVDVNTKTDYGATALSFAADRGHLEIVKLLLKNKADANVKPFEKQQIAIMANVSLNFVMKATYSSEPVFVTVKEK